MSEHLGADVVVEHGEGVGDGRDLAREPLERRRHDEEVAEDHAHKEERRCGEHRRHDPFALIGLERRQEEGEHLPHDHRRAHHERRAEADGEARGKAAERRTDVELVAHKRLDGVGK